MTFNRKNNFSEWYRQIILQSELIDYYNISGCYILCPLSINIWKYIQKYIDDKLNIMDVQDCYFPMFVTKESLEKEKTHLDGFTPEVVWITRNNENVEENEDVNKKYDIAIRPTSETIIYPYFAKKIKSHRDLPIKYNQWCNVVRWELSAPMPFIRSREFLWQEGHTVHISQEDANNEAYTILDLYEDVYKNLLAVPVIKGMKTELEKFAGANTTLTTEIIIPDANKGVQGATSHLLGQTFSKIFDIKCEDSNNNTIYPWQNSWGFSTRSIGVMVMIHSDDIGLVLPPKIAPIQIIIIPCGINKTLTIEKKEELYNEIRILENELKKCSLRVKSDFDEHVTTGWKYNYWEKRGVPIRIEVGLRDFENDTFVVYQRYNKTKITIEMDDDIQFALSEILDNIHYKMFQNAYEKMNTYIEKIDDLYQLNSQKFSLMPICNKDTCELEIRNKFIGVKCLCIPLNQSSDDLNCIVCNEKTNVRGLFGKCF